MDNNSNVIMALCSHLCVTDGVSPLEPREWAELAKRLLNNNLQPEDIINFSESDFLNKLQIGKDFSQRIIRLLDRSASLSFELSRYANMGIYAITRADREYPERLKKKLGNACPPIFYYSGNLSLLDNRSIGFVGSRSAGEADEAFTKRIVSTVVGNGFSAVSGGAKGIDSIACEFAISCGGTATEFLSDSMLRKLRNSTDVEAIQNSKLLLLSVTKPDAGFNAGIAMMRNKYIYSQSDATIIIKSDKGKGGTWNGAIENLKKGWCTEYCRNIKHPGNVELIRMGAIPIDENWDGTITKTEFDKSKVKSIQSEVKKPDGVQLSLFD